MIKKYKAIVISVSVVLLLCVAALAYRSIYYSERDRIRARLESMPNVKLIKIHGADDMFHFKIRAVDFRLKDRPESFVQLEVPQQGILNDSDHI
jgi:hypothetical protein